MNYFWLTSSGGCPNHTFRRLIPQGTHNQGVQTHLNETVRFKLHALRRIRKILTLEQVKVLANSFVNTQFRYAPLIWLFTSKNSMLKINKIHRRTLHVVYDDYNSTYEELFASYIGISIYQKHLKNLAIEVCKSLTNLNPDFMWLFFKNRSIAYNLEMEIFAFYLLHDRLITIQIQYNFEVAYFGISFLYQLKRVLLLKNSNRNWIMYNRFTVLVLHVEDFEIFVYYVTISFC